MLDLKSPRWARLQSHIEELPPPAECVRAWKASIGTPAEARRYDALFNQYLHQLTILSCAWAVVPHIVSRLPSMPAKRRLGYLCDVAAVETKRVSRGEARRAVEEVRQSAELPEALRAHFVESTRARLPPLPADLARDYLRAIDRAKRLAIGLLQERWAPKDLCRLLGVLTALHARDQARLATALMQPTGLWLEAEHEGKSSISTLLVE